MGVPKFFRFISERYPMMSQLIQQNSIPEFDNLYLDMNGIIHNCTHPSDDVQYRVSQEQMFISIFNYIETLFSKIKPKKLFFMAMDGVAPRAKMNQQRERRFRTAKEAQAARDEAKRKGVDLPPEPPFDSNAITPGTPFMALLSEQIKYFVNKKVTEDADWRNVKVVFSGHEVPGEGEHKIMEYIRYQKAQPDRDPNLRHCLYGLDADLILLALLSHDPHFCLLREEVVFGPTPKKSKSVESTNFYLLHIALLREYLDLEFSQLHSQPNYDLELVIDDMILLFILIGNDFLPHLPSLHIKEGAIGLLFDIYKKVFPLKDGYLNNHGVLNLSKFQLILNHLSEHEKGVMEQEVGDLSYFQSNSIEAQMNESLLISDSQLSMTPQQFELFKTIKAYVLDKLENGIDTQRLKLDSIYPARDRKFLSELADNFGLEISFDEFDQDQSPVILIGFDEDLVLTPSPEENGFDDDMDDAIVGISGGPNRAVKDEARQEWINGLREVITAYDNAPVKNLNKAEEEKERKFNENWQEWKDSYYLEKYSWNRSEGPEKIKLLVFKYIEGIQWILHYYYDGTVSWSWFFPYHYAPKTSDIKDIETYKFNFTIGTPFRPFEQLLGVLPVLSSVLIPEAFRDLMSSSVSPILDFYPTDFETDLNGKKNDWEAVVKIPFISEERLLNAMGARYALLTPEEQRRNQFGSAWEFVYDKDLNNAHVYPSSLAPFLPDISNCRTKMLPFDIPKLEREQLYKGLSAGVLLGKEAMAGFPSIKTIPHAANLDKIPVKVFQQDSREESMLITVNNIYREEDTSMLAHSLIGDRTFVNWPFLREALVVRVSNSSTSYEREISPIDGTSKVIEKEKKGSELMNWDRLVHRLSTHFLKRYAVNTGPVDVILHVSLLKGLKPAEDGALVKEYEDEVIEFPVQVTVRNVVSEDPRFLERAAIPVEEDFPVDSKVFFLGRKQYGVPALVLGHENGALALQTFANLSPIPVQVKFSEIIEQFPAAQYAPSHFLSRSMGMTALTLSKITSSMLITHGDTKLNIGLNLKFESKGLKVLGYTRKSRTGWEYSAKAVELIKEYKTRFPDVVAALDAAKGADLRRASEIFPEDVEKKAATLKAWLAEIGSRNFEKVPLNSEKLDKVAIDAIEKAADDLVDGVKNNSGAIMRKVPRTAVLKSDQATMRLANQEFSVGDRVVNVVEYGSVGLGAHGTVVGVVQNEVDVVFDHAFMGGNNLDGRCSQYRGQTLIRSVLLNLTRAQFAYVPRDINLAKKGRPQPWIRNPAQSLNSSPNYPKKIMSRNPRNPTASNEASNNNSDASLDNQAIRPHQKYNSSYHAVPPPQSLREEPSQHSNRGTGAFHRGNRTNSRGNAILHQHQREHRPGVGSAKDSNTAYPSSSSTPSSASVTPIPTGPSKSRGTAIRGVLNIRGGVGNDNHSTGLRGRPPHHHINHFSSTVSTESSTVTRGTSLGGGGRGGLSHGHRGNNYRGRGRGRSQETDTSTPSSS